MATPKAAIELDERYRIFSPWQTCTLCDIGNYAARHVIGSGYLPCDILFIGEGPGKQENMKGRPFVGPAGHILNDWLQALVHHWASSPTHIEDGNHQFIFYITNLVACRPCNTSWGPNRPPTPREIINCRPRLQQICDLAQPRIVVLLGKAAECNTGELHFCCPVLTLRHPAYILRCGGKKSKEYQPELDRLIHFVERIIP